MPTDPKTLLERYKPKTANPLPLNQQLCQVRYSPDGKRLAAGTFEGTIRFWDATTTPFQDASTLSGHDGWVQCLAFRADGNQLYTADSWGRLCGWSLTENSARPIWSVKDAHDGWIHALAISPDGKSIVTGGRDRTVRLTNPENGKALNIFAAAEDVLAVAFHPDGNSIVTGDLKGVVRQWNAASGKVERELDAKAMFLRDRIQDVGGVRCFAFTPDGSMLFVGGSQPKSGGFVQGVSLILAFDWATGKGRTIYKGTNENEGYTYELAWNAGGFLIGVSSGQPGQGRLFFQRPEDPQPFFTQPLANPHSVAVHPDGKRLVVSATNANSAGNGRNLGKNKDYPGNFSPLHVFDIPG